jgi:hypothetical protein
MEWSLGDDGLDTLTVFFCFMAFINIPISVMWLIFSYLIATPPKNKFYNWFINKKNDE